MKMDIVKMYMMRVVDFFLYQQEHMPAAVTFLIKVVLSILILFVGMKLIKKLVKVIRKSMEKSKLEKGLISFLASLLKYVLYFLLIMLILSQFGVTTASVVALLGSAGLTVGLALQGSLSNFAGGVLILLVKPFVVGDYIIENSSGKEGTVSDITLCYTKLLTIDNRVVMVPNGALSNSTITNVSKQEKRRVDVVVSVAYDSDLSKVKAVLEEVVRMEADVLVDEPVNIVVSELADSAIKMTVMVWVASPNYFPVKWRMTEQIKRSFDEQSIVIPFPQLDIHTKM